MATTTVEKNGEFFPLTRNDEPQEPTITLSLEQAEELVSFINEWLEEAEETLADYDVLRNRIDTSEVKALLEETFPFSR